jgi:pimeloyl-ACP methyl ester carboxylesterase
VALLVSCMPPSWGASALLHPGRRPVGAPPDLLHRDLVVEGDGITLRGWVFPAGPGTAGRGVTVVYLHGSGGNRAAGTEVAARLVPLGFEVVAFDSRGHGESGGEVCTYGYHEKRDLSRVLDRLGASRVILVGVSLGGAVALQEAADDPRVVGVVSAAAFTDLATFARDRVAGFASEAQYREALVLAERAGRFEVAAVSPVLAAARLRVPVLLVHGEDDHVTSLDHARRLFAALAGPKRLRVVPGGNHHDALGRVWPEVEHWVVGVARSAPVGASLSRP